MADGTDAVFAPVAATAILEAAQRYLDHIELIRPAPKNLIDYFRNTVLRNVDKDRTVSLEGRLYEAPAGLIGKTVQLKYHKSEPERIEVLSEEKSYGFLSPLNQQVNSRVRRNSGRDTELVPDEQSSQSKPERSSAEQRYRGGKLFGQERSS